MHFLKLNLVGSTQYLFRDWVACADLFFDAPSPVPVKALLEHKGWISCDEVRSPLSLDDLDSRTEEGLLEADKRVNEWYEELIEQ